jgi:hypothetical protein
MAGDEVRRGVGTDGEKLLPAPAADNRDELLLRPAPLELTRGQVFDPTRLHLLADLAPRPGRARLTGVLRIRAASRLTDALRGVRVCRRTPGHEHQRPADRRRPKDDSEIHTLLLFLAIARRCPVLYAGDPEASLKPLEETLNIHHIPRGNSLVPDTVDPRGPKGK